MTQRELKEKRLKNAIAKCMILDDEDRDFWLSHASLLPDIVLANVTEMIEAKNAVMDDYVNAALKNDPDKKYLTTLKTRIQKIKQKAFALDESEEHSDAQTSMEEQLKDLDK